MEILQKRKKHQSRLALVNLSSMFIKHHRSENSVVKSWWSNRFLSSIVENVLWLLYTFLLLSYYIKKEVPNFADTDWNILLSHRSSYFKKPSNIPIPQTWIIHGNHLFSFNKYDGNNTIPQLCFAWFFCSLTFLCCSCFPGNLLEIADEYNISKN